MLFFEILLLALALSMDAFAVAVATGIRLRCATPRQSFRLAFHFGLFQALMPIIGWFAGIHVREYIESFDHWLAFILLSLVGLKMIRDALNHEEGTDDTCLDPTRGLSLVVLSVATSLDALAVGLSLALVGDPIWMTATAIGIVCALFTLLGLHIGRIAAKAASHLGSRAALSGGVVLILIGLNILREHGVFSLG